MDQINIRKRYYQNLQRGVNYVGAYVKSDRRSSLASRERISGFSNSSRKRLSKYLRNSLAEYYVFITLTYPPGYGHDGYACKRDLRALGARYRRCVCASVCALDRVGAGAGNGCVGNARSQSWSMAWWQEWQANGRLHFHILGTHYVHYLELARWWFDVVGSGSQDHLLAGTSIEKIRGGRTGVATYAAKYAAKSDQKDVPVGYVQPGRFWGVMGLRDSVAATMALSAYQMEDEAMCMLSKRLLMLKESYMLDGRMAKTLIETDWGVIKKYCWQLCDDEVRLELLKILAQMQADAKCL